MYSLSAAISCKDRKAKNRGEQQYEVLAKDKHKNKEGRFSDKNSFYPKRRSELP